MKQEITIRNNHFYLHHTGAMYWKQQRMLLIADVHLGKVSHFRKHGSAVPIAAVFRNFEALDEVMEFYEPERICFLGDLFHSKSNQEWDLFCEWALEQKADIILVRGNHDIIPLVDYECANVQVTEEWILNSFLLSHYPDNREGLFTICGHIHPGVRLIGLGRQELQLPCFHKMKNQIILPAFGTFTGLYCMDLKETDQIFAIADQEVVAVPHG